MDPEDKKNRDRKSETLAQADGEIERARAAQLLLENPILVDALQRIEESWTEAWRNTPPAATEQREKAYQILFALTEFKAELRTVIETGILAAKTTDALRGEKGGSTDHS